MFPKPLIEKGADEEVRCAVAKKLHSLRIVEVGRQQDRYACVAFAQRHATDPGEAAHKIGQSRCAKKIQRIGNAAARAICQRATYEAEGWMVSARGANDGADLDAITRPQPP